MSMGGSMWPRRWAALCILMAALGGAAAGAQQQTRHPDWVYPTDGMEGAYDKQKHVLLYQIPAPKGYDVKRGLILEYHPESSEHVAWVYLPAELVAAVTREANSKHTDPDEWLVLVLAREVLRLPPAAQTPVERRTIRHADQPDLIEYVFPTRVATAHARLDKASSSIMFGLTPRPSGNTGGGDGPQGGGGPGPDAPRPDYTKPFMKREVTRSAVLLSKPEPIYTEEARRRDLEGIVRLRLILTAGGQVQIAETLQGLPYGLTESAQAAAQKIKFRPAEKDGRTVSQYVTIEYNFNIIYDDTDVTRKAVILSKPQPVYTEAARRAGTRGTVVLRVVLAKTGEVTTIEVQRGLPNGLTEQAISAARQIKFEPAVHGDRPVSMYTTLEYEFAP
ncbi:MAG TPA: energy transducer TonB [Pyrinomonadaceae bacterium]|jgi:TonB family protein